MKRLALVALLFVAACRESARLVECTSDAQCSNSQVCGADGVCQTAPACPSGEMMCGTVCTDVGTLANCGACGHACTGSTSCIAGACAIPIGATVVTAPAYADQGSTGLLASAAAGDPAATFSWSISGGLFSNGTTQATGAAVHFSAGSGAVLTLQATGTSLGGEHSTGVATVELLASLPTSVAITTAAMVTAGTAGMPAQITAAQPDVTYAWSINNGVLGASSGTSTTYSAGASGQLMLSVVATSPSGSVATGQAIVQIEPGVLPSGFTIVTPASAAVGTTNLDAHVVAQAGISYAWAITGGSFANQSVGASGADVKFTVGAGPTVFLTCTGSNQAGESQTVTASVAVTIAAPQGLSATGGSNQVSLAWSGVPGATRYHLLRQSGPAAPPTQLADSTTTSWIDSALPNGKSYYYQVEAATDAVSSVPTGIQTATTILPAPQDLLATGGAAVGLSWSAVAGASQYLVERQTGAAALTPIATVAGLSYTDAQVDEGTQYGYAVRALTADAQSADSNLATAITVLDAPTGLSAAVNVYDVSLTWNATLTASGYQVLRSTSAGSGFVVIGTSASASYCNCASAPNPPAPATTYFYEVRATSAAAESDASNVASATTVSTAPEGFSAQLVGRDTAVLTWSPVPGASAYGIERSTSTDGPFTQIGTASAATYTDSDLPYACSYYYEVVTLGPSGASPPSAIVSVSTSAAAYASGAGLSGGEIQAVAFDRSQAGKAWAGVQGGAGIYTSMDSGATWSGNGAGLGASSVHALAFSQGSVFAGARGAGIYTLAPGASAWVPANSGLIATDTYSALAADPGNSGVIYAASYKGVYASRNNGASWAGTALVPVAPILSLAVSPADPATVYAATDGAGLFTSRDGGATWASLPLPASNCQGGIAIDPVSASRLWVGTTTGVYRSSDAGQTWSAVGAITQVRSLAWSGSVLLAGTSQSGLQRSDGQGAFAAVAGSTNGVETLAQEGMTLLAGSLSGAGLWRSTDGGDHWTAANAGVNASSATAVAIARSAPKTIYGVAGASAVKSSDGGLSWTVMMGAGISYPVIAAAVAVDPTHPQTVYVGAQGVLRSKDGGVTWATTNANFTPSALALASTTTAYAAVYNTGVYKSVNIDGDAPLWTLVSAAINGQGMRTVAVAPGLNTQVYAAGDTGFFASADGASTWSAPAVQPSWIRSIAVDPTAAATVYIVTAGSSTQSQLLKSVDAGQSWSDLGFGSTAVQNLKAIAVDPVNPGVLFALGTASNGSAGGLFKSSDGGASWTDVSAGLGTHSLRALALDPVTSGSLIVASGDNGLLVSSSGGL